MRFMPTQFPHRLFAVNRYYKIFYMGKHIIIVTFSDCTAPFIVEFVTNAAVGTAPTASNPPPARGEKDF